MRAVHIAAAASIVAVSLVTPLRAQVYKPGDGVSLPTVVTKVNPQYTEEAKAARIEGVVELNATVGTGGAVSDVTVTKSLDKVLGLDDQAVKALQQWTFNPGRKDGKEVAVNLDFRINFTLR